ncbi:MAG: hypothetical protein DMF57_18440 [Acidobacteria bacterium]|nr:MAG: hypothetical protein DMF57_18440 [Acidobacteriota bacterium]
MIKFGTSGWRGIIGEDFTFENVRIASQGIANYLKKSKQKGTGMVVSCPKNSPTKQRASWPSTVSRPFSATATCRRRACHLRPCGARPWEPSTSPPRTIRPSTTA